MDRFGRYTVFECLGAGGMATVHRATIEIGQGVIKEVALKRMLPQLADDKKTLDDFIREAKLAAQLQHPNIVRILELGRNGTTYFIAMELVRGPSVLTMMKLMHARQTVAPVGIVIALLGELCEALDYASHAPSLDGEPMEIVHRDLSPSNLIIDPEGHLKIIDFGVAKTTSGKFQTSSGMVKGKLGYMALEVLAGKPVDKRADIFSVGVVAWEMLTGRRLFVGVNEYEVISKIRKGCTTPPSAYNKGCSAELDEIVLHALSRKREDRWPSAGVMKNALDTLRRTHRDGPREVAAWRRSLVPDTEVEEDSTTMELVSLREMMVPSSPSITNHTGITQIRAPDLPDLDFEALDEPPNRPTEPEPSLMMSVDDHDEQTVTTEQPSLGPPTIEQPSLAPAYDALMTEPHVAAIPREDAPRDEAVLEED